MKEINNTSICEKLFLFVIATNCENDVLTLMFFSGNSLFRKCCVYDRFIIAFNFIEKI